MPKPIDYTNRLIMAQHNTILWFVDIFIKLFKFWYMVFSILEIL